MTQSSHPARNPLLAIGHWLWSDSPTCAAADDNRIDWPRAVVFIALHSACVAVIWVGVSWAALVACVISYGLRMFFITGFYHRYFAHRSFKTSRVFQFVMALLGCTAGQRGALWWAGHHRHHHGHADQQEDVHSPGWYGLIWAHTGWFLTRANYATPWRFVRDWARYPELRWLNRLDWLPLIAFAALTWALGAGLAQIAPGWHTSGPQMLVWAFFIATVALYHATYTINSLAHRFGRRRFDTGDTSHNNLWLSLLTLGEGWHNNHHHYPATARQGFYWWELDPTWYVLMGLATTGVIRELRPVPKAVLAHRRLDARSC